MQKEITIINQMTEYCNTELIKYVNVSKNIFNLIDDIILILTPDLKLKLINNFTKSYYDVKNKNLILNRNISSLSIFPKSFNKIIKKLKHLDHIALPVIQVNTTESNDSEEELEICWTISYLLSNKKIPIGIILIGKLNFEKFYKERIDYLQIYLNTIIDSVPIAIYWKNTDGVYLGCNIAMVKKSNFTSKEDVIGKTDEELWPESSFRKNDQEVILSNKTMEVQENFTLNNGQNKYFVSIKTPLKNKHNKTIGIAGNTLEVTDIINAKAKAEAANNVKTQFLLNMQHDIKTPISHIIGLTNVMSSMDNLPKRLKEYINYITISGERLMSLIVDVLHYCDIETDTMTKNQEWEFNLSDLIQQTRDLNIIAINEKNLKIIVNHDNAIEGNLIGNKHKIYRILINLFDNALKFTSKGTIKITTKLVKFLDYPKVIIELTVEDTGIGIPKDKYDSIFERFSRLSPSGSNMYKGLGLGLWMVKQLAKDINGEIYVSSVVNHGSTFKLTFPCKINPPEKHKEQYDAKN